MERELEKAALVSIRSTKRQLKEKRIRAFDDDRPISGLLLLLLLLLLLF